MADVQALARLRDTLPNEAAQMSGPTLDIDYEGLALDPRDFLDLAAEILRQGDTGHLDVFDDQAGVFTRYELTPGERAAKSFRYDDILEHTKREGNW